MVAKHLKKYKSITPFKALHDYGIMRLAARCHELKQIGIPIKSELIDAGDGIKYARYTLMSSK
jgi:helix-turn-helix protein